ncbi:MAG: cupin domain-containing protein [Candidatus Caldarchaeum sp.]|uniref:Cupin domain-containing protein n=1 Tax=Caldiarchaeum subterraneum TaxID=311458 RepID=A0A7C5QD58_CALS0
MHVVNTADVLFEQFSERVAKNTLRKTLVSDKDGSKLFRLRYYCIEPQGQTPFDIHDYEHVVIVVRGRGTVLSKDGETPRLYQVKQGDVIYIRSREPHQFINTGGEKLEFYCFSTTH